MAGSEGLGEASEDKTWQAADGTLTIHSLSLSLCLWLSVFAVGGVAVLLLLLLLLLVVVAVVMEAVMLLERRCCW